MPANGCYLAYPFSMWHGFACLAALVITAACVYPILAFVRRGWWFKREEVLASLSDDAKKIYIKTFLKIDSNNPSKDFDVMYTHKYGRYRLTIPTILLMATILPLSYLVADTAIAHLLIADSGAIRVLAKINPNGCVILLPGRALAAIIGAYLWIVYALIIGSVVYDMPPALLLTSALRMIAAAPLGYAIGGLAAPGLGTFLAFAIGAFPLQTVQAILQRLTDKKLNLDIASNERDDWVIRLDGVDPPTADRLQQAGITTVAQLAYSDPVQLSLRTNLRFAAVLDLADQALARIYLGAKLNKLMPYGLRGAMEIRHLMDDVGSTTAAKSDPAREALAAIATAAEVPLAGLERAFDEIGQDPYAEFLWEVWS